MKKLLTILLSGTLLLGACASLIGCGNKTDADFTYWISVAEGQSDYGSYENNPGVKYMTEKEWQVPGGGKEQVKLQFIVPSSAQSPEDAFSTAVRDPADIMELTYSQDSIIDLYENGKALDITEYVNEYMPNYLKFLNDNGFYDSATNLVNGERRFLQLYSYYKSPNQPSWLGYNYRRDWIVGYGYDPSTGAAFTGGWNADKTKWTDNVKFPSFYGLTYTSPASGYDGAAKAGLAQSAEVAGYMETYAETYDDYDGTYPVTISDWEWMLDIIEKALVGEGIEGGYCTNLYYPGFNMAGNLVSSFGGGGVEWYKNTDGTVHFGVTESTFEVYVQTMRDWYSRGWIDTGFQTHTELFYRTDEKTVNQGKVGLWCGMDSQLFNALDISDGDENHATYGICVYGAPYPINDKYGEEENKFTDPYCFYQVSREICSTMITTNAINTPEKEAKLPALFTMLDYLYSDAGAVLKGGGFTKEQVEETQDDLYLSIGLENGMCEYDEAQGIYVFTQEALKLTNNQTNLLKPLRLLGLEDYIGYKEPRAIDEYRRNLWTRYTNTGRLEESFISQLSSDDNKEYNRILTLVREEFSKQVPAFIKGTTDMNSWSSFTRSVTRLGTQKITDMLNEIL